MLPTVATQKIAYYRTNVGLFIKVSSWYGEYAINGVPLSEGIDKLGGYKYFPTIENIERVSLKRPGTTSRTGWQLKNPACVCEMLPLNLTVTDISVDVDDDGDMVWSGPYGDRAAMYDPVHVTSESYWDDVPFELVELGNFTIDRVTDPINMKIRLHQETGLSRATADVSLANIVTYEEIERLLVPEFLIHERPCCLSSHQMYKIVRNYVKENYDRQCAAITSDYDFCFTVKRRVKKAVPTETKIEQYTRQLRSYKPPRFKTEKVNEALHDVFEMTYAEYKNGGYEKYTPIAPLCANSLAELATFLKRYLDELMEVINTKAEECPHCEGHGVVSMKKSTNSHIEQESLNV